MMIYVSSVFLLSAQMLVWGSLSRNSDSKAALKEQIKGNLTSLIEEREALLGKLEKKIN